MKANRSSRCWSKSEKEGIWGSSVCQRLFEESNGGGETCGKMGAVFGGWRMGEAMNKGKMEGDLRGGCDGH